MLMILPGFLAERLGQEKRAAQIHRHLLVVLLFRRVPEIGPLLHARVVHQDVGRAEFLPCRVHQAAKVIHLRDVRANHLAHAPAGLDGAACLVGAGFAAPVVDDDPGALAAQAFRDALADTGAASGYNGHFPLQTHGFLSLSQVDSLLDAKKARSRGRSRGLTDGEPTGASARTSHCTLEGVAIR